MKKFYGILLTFVFIVPILIGMIFHTVGYNDFKERQKFPNHSLTNEKTLGGDKWNFSQDDLSSQEYVIKDFEDYFVDNSLFYTTDEIKQLLGGNGTENSPYIVDSTQKFYLLNKIGLAGVFVELRSDIILNDETFDGNGQPKGGDGVVYSWRGRHAGDLHFNGNGHEIRGMYFNDPAKRACLFDYFEVCENVHLRNVYINAGSSSAGIAYYAKYLYNCSVSGYITSNEMIAGLCSSRSKEIKNCVNYAEVYSPNREVYGISQGAPIVENCKNYGRITGKGLFVSGVCGSQPGDVIRDCVNYGEVNSSWVFTGGVVGGIHNDASGKGLVVENCVNYGDINAGRESGGVVGMICSNSLIYNCANYGSCTNDLAGQIVGTISAQYNAGKKVSVIIKNCSVYSKDNNSVVGTFEYLDNAVSAKVIYDGIQGDFGEDKNTVTTLLGYNERSYKTIVETKNIVLNYTGSKRLNLFANRIDFTCIVGNVLLNNENADLSMGVLGDFDPKGNININGGIIINSIDGQSYYQGENFKNFYYDRRQGKICLNNTNSAFHEKITERWLQDNEGFKKLF